MNLAGGFCVIHERYLNEFGWCDECGEPKAAINPPISLGKAATVIRDDFRGREPGTAVRHCDDPMHIFETTPGRCQCGSEWWDGPQ